MNRTDHRNKHTKRAERDAIEVRLRYLALKARRDPKTLSLADLDELCALVAASAPVGGSSLSEEP